MSRSPRPVSRGFFYCTSDIPIACRTNLSCGLLSRSGSGRRPANFARSFAFTNTLKDAGIRISMDGRGRWMDNVFIERLWRSLKYECVYLNAFETGTEAKTGIGRWIGYYNADRPHSAFGGRTPDEVYATQASEEKLAA
jgi:hypothetical protein